MYIYVYIYIYININRYIAFSRALSRPRSRSRTVAVSAMSWLLRRATASGVTSPRRTCVNRQLDISISDCK